VAAVAVDLQALEPGGPAPVEDPVDPDLVMRLQYHAAAHGVALSGDQLVEVGAPTVPRSSVLFR